MKINKLKIKVRRQWNFSPVTRIKRGKNHYSRRKNKSIINHGD